MSRRIRACHKLLLLPVYYCFFAYYIVIFATVDGNFALHQPTYRLPHEILYIHIYIYIHTYGILHCARFSPSAITKTKAKSIATETSYFLTTATVATAAAATITAAAIT